MRSPAPQTPVYLMVSDLNITQRSCRYSIPLLFGCHVICSCSSFVVCIWPKWLRNDSIFLGSGDIIDFPRKCTHFLNLRLASGRYSASATSQCRGGEARGRFDAPLLNRSVVLWKLLVGLTGFTGPLHVPHLTLCSDFGSSVQS